MLCRANELANWHFAAVLCGQAKAVGLPHLNVKSSQWLCSWEKTYQGLKIKQLQCVEFLPRRSWKELCCPPPLCSVRTVQGHLENSCSPQGNISPFGKEEDSSWSSELDCGISCLPTPGKELVETHFWERVRMCCLILNLSPSLVNSASSFFLFYVDFSICILVNEKDTPLELEMQFPTMGSCHIQ